MNYKLKLMGSITDGKYTESFSEEDVVHLVIEKGDRKLFYETNDLFLKDKKIVERLKKLVEDMDTHGDVPKSWVKDVLMRKIIGDK